MGCDRAREFLSRHKIASSEHNVRREPLGPKEALALLRSVKSASVKSGKKILEFEISKTTPSDAELLKHFLGRSGTLRAPVIRIGSHLIAGFDEAVWKKLLGS
jgi:arsenate reductase-like glutaredoxin family protein